MVELDAALLFGQVQGAPRRRGHDAGEPFSEDDASAGGIEAEELAHLEVEVNADAGPGQIGQAASVAAVKLEGSDAASVWVAATVRVMQLGWRLIESLY